MEEWKQIIGFEDYEVSTEGRVKHHAFVTSDGRHKVEKVLKGIPDKNGYLQVRLWKNGAGHTKKIHRLVAEAFIENLNEYRCINHKNGIKSCNLVSNLEWCNHSSNMIHAYSHELRKPIKGENNNQHKLTWDDVSYIRSNCIPHDPQLGMRSMARKFNVTVSVIRGIYNGTKWRVSG